MTSAELDEYFRTTFEQKMLIKMPDREEDHLLPATRLLDKRREILEVHAFHSVTVLLRELIVYIIDLTYNGN